MWHGFLLLWEDRNSNQHGRDSIKQNTIKRDIPLKKTQQLDKDKEKLEYEDQKIYSKPVEEWEQETNRKIRQWINLAEPLTKKPIQKKHKQKVAADQWICTHHLTMNSRIYLMWY
jgi:hypothetical protein